MKKIAFILAFSLAFPFGEALANAQITADAATAPTTALTSDCSIPASDFAELQAIQTDPTLSPSQELSQELALRKQLLSQTITCAINEAQTLQQTVNAVSAPDAESAAIQSQLAGKIDDILNFYNLELAKLGDSGIAATESIAKEMIAWRSADYDPLVGQANNFILWSKNQDLFQTAENRFTQTQRIVSFIEAAAENNDLQSSLSTVQSSIENAEAQNDAAETALAQFLSPDQSLSLIQQSLQSLADTYQKFTDLNGMIQKLLPTGQQ